ncbi:MAG: glycoside hydrolase family 5 protein [Bacteroidia bacterium]|nr:glycoside hydrolase family 5 protein [Bacteroidia bacterium]
MKISILAAGMLLCGSCLMAQQPKSPVELNGALQVEGNQMVGKGGLPPQLRGISLSWSLWQGKKYYNPEVVSWLVKDFHISLLRASMGVEPKGGYLANNEEQLRLMTIVIDKAISEGIYVLVDWHDHNAEKHLEESKAFFALMAQKYSGVPNVIYEIFNEPARQNWEMVKGYSVEVIKTIRQYDKKNIIVVGSPKWDQDVDVAAADPIRGFDNLVYSFHFYASDPNHQEKLRAKAEAAMKLGLPLFVTEWGVGESNGNGEFNLEKSNRWVEWMEGNRLSWVAWNVTDKNETTAIMLPGAPVAGGWSIEQLTESGKYLREKLSKLNK